MGQHRAARPVKRNALIGAALVAAALMVVNSTEAVGEVPWATDATDTADTVDGRAGQQGAVAPVDPEQAALEMAEAAQRGETDEDSPAAGDGAGATSPSGTTDDEDDKDRPEATGVKRSPVSPATISGTVRGPGGALLDDVVVEAVAVTGPQPPTGDELTYARVADTVVTSGDDQVARGAYELEVPPGAYVVRFRQGPGDRAWVTDHLTGLAATGTRRVVATPVVVRPGASPTLPEHRMRTGRATTVRGLVWDEDAAMVPDVVVALVRREGRTMVPVDFALTDEVGAFEFPRATAGEQYTVRVRGGTTADGTVLPLAHAWYGDTTEASEAEWLEPERDVETVTTGPIRMVERVESVAAPAIRGDVRVGETLEVGAGRWNLPADLPVEQRPGMTYQWSVDGEEVPSAVAPRYRPVAADLGAVVSVRVRATVEGRTATAHASPTYVRPPAPPTLEKAPTVSGEGTVGTTLSVDPGSWSPAAGTGEVDVSVVWRRDGIRVPGQIGRTYRVRPGDVGHDVTASVEARAGRSDPARVSTDPVRVANRTSTVTATRTRAGLRVTVDVAGSARPTGELVALDGDTVVARQDLTRSDAGTATLTGVPDRRPVKVVFLAGPGVSDSQVLPPAIRRR